MKAERLQAKYLKVGQLEAKHLEAEQVWVFQASGVMTSRIMPSPVAAKREREKCTATPLATPSLQRRDIRVISRESRMTMVTAE